VHTKIEYKLLNIGTVREYFLLLTLSILRLQCRRWEGGSPSPDFLKNLSETVRFVEILLLSINVNVRTKQNERICVIYWLCETTLC